MRHNDKFYSAFDRLQKARQVVAAMEENLEGARKNVDIFLALATKSPLLWPRNWDGNSFTILAVEFGLYEACVELARVTLKKIDDAIKNALSYSKQEAAYRRQGGTAPVLESNGQELTLGQAIDEALIEVTAYAEDIASIREESLDHLEALNAMV